MSKKRIIALITVIILLFATGVSVGVFLYTRGTTQAADGNKTTEQTPKGDNQVVNENPATPDDNISNVDNENTSNETTNNNVVDNNTTNNVENTNTVANTNNKNTNNTANTENAGNTNNENTENTVNIGVTTDTGVNNIGETTIERVEEQERLVSKAYWDWWKPMTIAPTRSNVNVDEPNLSVKKTVITETGDSKLVYAGQNMTYIITVTNNSDVDMQDIEITDKIPQNTTFVSMEDALIDEVAVGTKTTVKVKDIILGAKWVVTVPAGKTVIARFTIKVNEKMLNEDGNEVPVAGTISNIAIANGEKSKDPTNNPDEGDETKTAIIRSNKSSVIIREIDKEYVEVETAKIGDLITYTITVENTGDVKGTTYIQDSVPAGTEFVSAPENEGTIISEDKDSIVWSVTLDAKETITKTFTVKVVSTEKTIKNVADVGGTPTNEDDVETAEIDVDKTATKVNGTDITAETKVKAGDVITYTINVINKGTATLTDVVVTDDLLPNFSETIESLEPGATETYTVEYTVTQPDVDNKTKITNVATATDGTTTGTDITAETKVKAGDKVTYTIVVTNTGSVTLTKVVVTDDLLPNFSETIESLAPGATETYTVEYTVTQTDVDNKAKITNVATATDGTTTGTDTDETVPIDKTSKLEVVKTADKAKAEAGDTINYTITVTNKGNVTLLNVPVTDTLTTSTGTQNLTLYSDDTYTTVITTIPKLEVTGEGASVTLYAKYEVTLADITSDNVTIKNIATAKETSSNEVSTEITTKYKYTVKYYYENSEGTVEFDGKKFIYDLKDDVEYEARLGTVIKEYEEKVINGYVFYKVTPEDISDSTKASLTITNNSENNVINVYYVKKLHSYQVKHYLQNIDGSWPETPADTDTVQNIKYGDVATYEPNEYKGFGFDTTLTKQENGVMNGTDITVPDNDNLVIKLYYTRNSYGYVVNYLDYNTKGIIHAQKTVDNQPFGKVITSASEVISIAGYKYHSVDKNSLTIDVENNVINIYYTAKVRTTNIVEKSTTIRKTNLVLVLDLSSSMEDGTTRLNDAKVAAKNFIDQIYNNENVSGINIEVVTFNSRNPIVINEECYKREHYEKGTHKSNGNSNEYDGCKKIGDKWYSKYETAAYSGTQVLSTSLPNNTATNYSQAQTLKNAISAIEIPDDYKNGGYGTHIYAALQEANKQITSLKNTYKNNENVVVFLGDGRPTSTNYSGYKDNTDDNIEDAGETLQKNATVYCIRLGNEAQNSTVFDYIASDSDKIIDANTQGDLITGFKAITSGESTRNYTATSVNGIITIEADLDTTKSITVTKPDGTLQEYKTINELNQSEFISYNSTQKKIIWNVLKYEDEVKISISYWIK